MNLLTTTLRDARLRELLLWCAPALVAGLVVRVFMEMRMPYGYIQYDTADFLVTPFRLLADHRYIIASKKAFFTPTFFAIPFFLHIPALFFVPMAQHLMGLLEVLLAGSLIRMWLPLWRWIIVPATLLIALSPWQLWYEQTLMGEANYVFFLFLVGWLGSHWMRRPSWAWFACFALSLFCICGTRAEGKIMLLFGVACSVIVLRKNWKAMAAAFASLALVYAVASMGGGGSHAFSLLYATLLPLTPDDIRSEPGAAPYVLPLRDKTMQQGENSADLVEVAKQIGDSLTRYVQEKKGGGRHLKNKVSDIEKRISVEILRREPFAVLRMPLVKFHLACDGWSSGSDFGAHALGEKLRQGVTRLGGMGDVLGPGLTGLPLDEAGLLQFAARDYDPAKMAWFNAWERLWGAASVVPRLPDRPAEHPRWAHDFISPIRHSPDLIPGIPVYFLLAFAGMLAAMFIPGRLRLAQAAFILSMLCTWYAATMVGVTNARFRFAYEPFCYIYAVAALVWAAGSIVRLRRPAEAKPEAPACTVS